MRSFGHRQSGPASNGVAIAILVGFALAGGHYVYVNWPESLLTVALVGVLVAFIALAVRLFRGETA